MKSKLNDSKSPLLPTLSISVSLLIEFQVRNHLSSELKTSLYCFSGLANLITSKFSLDVSRKSLVSYSSKTQPECDK